MVFTNLAAILFRRSATLFFGPKMRKRSTARDRESIR